MNLGKHKTVEIINFYGFYCIYLNIFTEWPLIPRIVAVPPLEATGKQFNVHTNEHNETTLFLELV